MQEPGEKLDTLPVEAEMIGAWREFLDALVPYVKISGEICVKNMARTVMLKISQYVCEENMFTMKDERIFEHYAGMMDSYAETVRLYNRSLPEIKDMRVKEILGGISDILVSQIKQYEEHIGNAPAYMIKNPIKTEKELILRSAYENVLSSLKTVLEGILSEMGYFEKNELRSVCFDNAWKNVNDSHIDFFSFIYQRAIEKGGLDIYKSYSGAIMECKNAINNFEARGETRYFYDALKQEKENLASIVGIQVSTLAEEVTEPGIEEAERLAVGKISDLLIATLEGAEKITEELSHIFNESENSVKMPVLMNYDGFLSFIEERGLCAYTDKLRLEGLETGTMSSVQLWKEKLDSFVRRFGDFVKEYSEPSANVMRYKKFLYEMRLKITDKLILTDEMLKGFRGLSGFYEKNSGRLREATIDEYMKIVDGINESILIKIDVLQEGMRSFVNDANLLLNSCSPPEPSEEELREAFMLRLGVWREEMLDSREFNTDYWKGALSNIPFIIRRINETGEASEYAVRAERKIARETDKLLKLEASYLRDCLLFEIITFEEILTYSVSKLRESDSSHIAEYVEQCDALEETLAKLCKLHNIIIISPKPYDTFNSSEHEVLVAEKNEGYKKGQIIKMMNSGFKYNEAVLVRANVIAAR